MAVTAPSNLAASAASSSRINLSWTNAQSYIGIEVQRSLTGAGSWSVLDTISGTATSYSDTSCNDGTRYYYQLNCSAGEDSDFSNTANAITLLTAPSGLSGTSTDGGTKCPLTWSDNCQNETGFKVYKNGALLATLGANVEAYEATGLTPGASYTFTVKAYNTLITSSASNSFYIVMADPPAAPSGLSATVTGTTTAQLNWTDNADNETRYYVEQSSTSASAGFAVIGTYDAANVTTRAVTGLTSNTQYWFRVRAYNASGYSSYCTVATCTTWAAIAAPTNLVVVAISDTTVYYYFDDNSELEDAHCVEMKIGAGAYSEIVQLPPNRNAHRKTGLSAGTTYTFKIRALQGASTYSSYSDEVSVTTLSAPDAPTGLAVSEYQDTWLRLGWTASTGATGYKIAQSPNDSDWTVIATIPDDITSFKVPDLTASTLYYFKVLAYNGAGDSAYTASVNQTTRASFSFSNFQRLIRTSSPNLIYLVELNPSMVLQGWALSDGQTYTYEIAFDERGAVLDAVYENGTALTELTSIAAVEAAAGSWWHDTTNEKVYVHTSGEDTPNDYTVTGSFWLYFTTWTDKDDMTIFDSNLYLPLVTSIPDISQEISPYYEGNFIISSGSISFLNAQIVGENYWDDKIGKYIFLNRKAVLKAGGVGFDYDDFVTVNTGIMDSYTCNDKEFSVALRDLRDGINRALPVAKYTVDEFPRLDESAEGNPRAFGYGVITNAVPVCIDTTNRIFEFHAGRIKSVEYVYQNGTALTQGTHYYIDYQRGRIILSRSMAYSADDIILVSFTGAVTDANETISTGAHIFKHLVNNYLDINDDNLDLDSIWATHVAKSTALALPVWKDTDSQELIRRIERSIEANTFQAADGKLGIKAALTSAPSDIFYIPDAHVIDFSMSRDKYSLFSTVNVYYGEDPSTDKYSLQQCGNSQLTHKHGVAQSLDVYTALTSSSAATSLGSDIIDLLDRFQVHFTVPRSLFTHQPGDLVYLNRTRYYNENPVAANKLLRIISISKSFSSGRTSITAEVV